MRTKVMTEADYVGDRFAEEARKIHFKEADPRGIYGEATRDEVAGLLDDGVEFLPLPQPARRIELASALQIFAQQHSRAMQPRLHRLAAGVQRLRDFVDGEFLNVPQHDQLPVVGRQ